MKKAHSLRFILETTMALLLSWISCFIVLSDLITAEGQMVPAFYVFGDSSVDAGNNNFVKTIARANFPPYGREFPGQIATGRFSDGKLIPDMLSEKLGFSGAVPAFLDPRSRGERSVKEVCFASAGSGFYDPTSKIFNVISMTQQIQFFRQYKLELAELVGAQNSSKITSEALYLVSAGSNDILLSYVLNPVNQKRYSAAEFTQIISMSFVKFMKEMYAEGARRFLLGTNFPVGCLPYVRTLFSKNGECVPHVNEMARNASDLFRAALSSLQRKLAGLDFAVVNVGNTFQQLSENPSKYGFVDGRKGCCGSGLVEVAVLCNQVSLTCPAGSNYVYWDSLHPSSSAYAVVTVDALNVLKQLLAK